MTTPTHLVLPSGGASLGPSPLVHLLPFHTPFSGPSSISTYFLTRPIPDTRESATPGATLLTSAFRGRQLVGQPLRVPEDYEGVVLSVPEKKRPVKQDAAELTRELEDARMEVDQAVQAQVDSGRRTSPRKRKVTDRFGAPAIPVKRVAAKKFRIDSDEDSSDEETVQPPAVSVPTAIPAPLSPGPTATGSTLVSSTSSTPLPTETDISAPASPPLNIVQDTLSRSPSPSPPPPGSQPPVLAPETTEEPVEEEMLLPPPPPARGLKVVSSFGEQGITLWSADDPVDEGRDEYFRCLGKGGWMELAGVLHQEESEDEA